MRKGRFDEARQLLNEILPKARGFGGSLFLGPSLTLEAELESARGNQSVAKQAIAEAVEVAFSSEAILHRWRTLVVAAMLLPTQKAAQLVEGSRAHATAPAASARLFEADALVKQDAALFRAAADLYASLEMPYQEARCRLESNELDVAERLIKRYGFEEGPLGRRLALAK